MDNQHQEFRIGLTVLVALAALVFLVVMFGKGPSIHFGDEYSIRVRFQRTPGISKKSPVYKNGVQIGKVTKVELVDDDREVEITIQLPKNRKVYTNEECRVRQTVIMGDASLEFVRIPNFTGKVEAIGPASGPLVGGAPADLLSGFGNIEGDLTKAINHVSDAAVHMSEFIVRANHFMGTPEELSERKVLLDNIAKEMQLTMQSTRRMTDGADKFLNDPQLQADVKKIIERMPEILDKSQNLVTESNLFVKDARTLLERGSTSLDKIDAGLDKAGKALDSVMTITDSVEGNVSEFMDSLKKSAVKLESLFDEITTIVQAVNNADGTFKRIMRSPEMYEKLMKTLDDVQSITGEVDRMLRTDIKPITHNVKIITDKVARDPSVFIRNLIRKQPRTKGHLPIWGDGLGSDSLGDLTCSLDRFSGEALHRDTVYYDFGSAGSTGMPGTNSNDRFEAIPDAPKRDRPDAPSIGRPTFAPDVEFDSEDIPLAPPSTTRRLQPGERISSVLSKPSLTLPTLPFFSKKASPALTQKSGNNAESIEQTAVLALTPADPNRFELEAKNDEIPEQGRIICVDPRYLTAEDMTSESIAVERIAEGSEAATAVAEKPVYRQMSYVEENDREPQLRFTPK